MILSDLVAGLQQEAIDGLESVVVEGLTEDSRQVREGFLFFARRGAKSSGLDHVSDAVEQGACAIISEQEAISQEVPWIRVPSISKAQSLIADRFYGHPSTRLSILGITGTNGKTTLAYLMETIARQAGLKAAVIGTISYRLPASGGLAEEVRPAPNTTPNALVIQSLLHECVRRGCDWVIMEVSSHALALGRTDRVEFSGAVFTNLTPDHLDFHGTMDNYFEAKSLLFRNMEGREDRKGFCIINIDDAYGPKMAALSTGPVLTYGVLEGNRADFRADQIDLNDSGARFRLQGQGSTLSVRIQLPGLHNVYNALSAAAASSKMGIPLSGTVASLEQIRSVPGRLEKIDCGQDFSVFVDYAHTEDALKNVLEAVRGFARKRVLVLFGCGGDRDRSKRPRMGEIAMKLSDWVVVTNDNPRSEDPRRILLDIEAGIRRTGLEHYEIEQDRAKAIGGILRRARKGDVVLLAGKGHETYQILADRTLHFDDREIVRSLLK